MNDPPQDGTAQNGQPDEADQLQRLRHLLDLPDDTDLVRLEKEIKRLEKQLQPEDLGALLPDAVLRVAREDDRLARVLEPTIQAAVHHSVRKDPKSVVDAIFPIMGPAIRKAIAEAISGMVDSLQQSLEHSLTVRGLQWRWEAWRSGSSYAAVVLHHTLVFRVEQVFLIHNETGLLLCHVAADAVEASHADMVSGMLTAIQDFVKDSFGGQQEDTLQNMKVGERTVWVEPGPWAAIAGVGVMHGNTPQELRQLFKEILEQIHLERQDALESFEGDSSPFEVCQPLLERCLQARYREGEDDKKKKMPLVFWVILAVLVLVGGYWLYSRSDERSRWDDYLQTLENVPGIVITKITKEDGQYRIAGMRDPLAVDPQTLLEHSSLDPAKVAAEWEFYQSVHPSLVLARAEALLAPPSEVRLRFDAGVLAGIGRAPHQWIVTAQRLAPSLGGVERLDLANLIDTDLGRLDALQEAIRNYTVYFEFDSVRVAPDQITKIDSLAKDIRAFYEAARRAQVEFYIEVVGHTDGSSGSLNLNMIFSRLRAEEVLRELRQRNLVLVPWLAVGKAYQEQVLEERQVKDRALNRRVTADVVYTDRPAPF